MCLISTSSHSHIKTACHVKLVQTSSIEGKVKQHVILYLGSDPLLRDKSNRTTILGLLKAKIFKQPSLFDAQAPKPLIALSEAFYNKYVIKYGEEANGHVSSPSYPQKAEYEKVGVKRLEVKDVKTFCHMLKKNGIRVPLITHFGISRQVFFSDTRNQKRSLAIAK